MLQITVELQGLSHGWMRNQDDLALPTHVSDRLQTNVVCELPTYALQLGIGQGGGRYSHLLTSVERRTG